MWRSWFSYVSDSDQTDDAGAESWVSRRRFGRAVAIGVPAAVIAGTQGRAEAAAPASWTTTGDAGTTAGPNYLGTRDAQALVVKTNGAERMRVLATGQVGIGTANPAGGLHSIASSAPPLRGDFTGTSGYPGVRGSTRSGATGASGVFGLLGPSGDPGLLSAGVLGLVYPLGGGSTAHGTGVIGHHTAQGTGVYGYTDSAGIGVYGSSVGGEAVAGNGSSGAAGGSFRSDYGTGVYASSDNGTAIAGVSEDGGPALSLSGFGGADGASIYSYDGNGLVVEAGASGNSSVAALMATNTNATGIYAQTSGSFSTAVYGHATGGGDGAIFLSDTGLGLYAGNSSGSSGYAGYFGGDVKITGALYKSGGAFCIDHPEDPTGRYLSHSFVESPDMMNVYNGNVVLDEHGRATVEMPSWFETVNRDFRYQLTPIGAHAPLYVSRKMAGGRFGIAGGTPGLEVSWQVTGIRHDRWAEANRIEVDEAKPADAQGTYLHPELYGKPAADGERPVRTAPTVPERRRTPRPPERTPH